MLSLMHTEGKADRFVQGTEEEQLFQKDALSVGVWKHPTRKWKKTVTEKTLDAYVETFNRMQKEGIPVPCVKDHKVNADSTLGYVEKMWRHNDKLLIIPRIKGRDNVQLVDTVQYVSVAIDDDFVDGKGNHFGESITHVGFTPEPVVSGQKGIVRITASRGQTEDAPIYLKSTAEVPKMKPEDLKKLQTVFGIQSELTEDSLTEVLTARFTGVSTEVSQLKGELDKVKTASLSKALDDETLQDRVEEVEDRIDRVGKAKGLVPATVKALKLCLVGEGENRSTYMLSRVDTANEQGRKPIRALAILDVIENIQIVKTGERTAQQFSKSQGDDQDEMSDEDLQKDIKKRASLYCRTSK